MLPPQPTMTDDDACPIEIQQVPKDTWTEELRGGKSLNERLVHTSVPPFTLRDYARNA